MSVFRSCNLAVCVIAATMPRTSNGQSAKNELPLPRPVVRQQIVRQAELAVLRQKVSMPLDQLVRPVTLDEWQNVAVAHSTTDPFVDDPVPQVEGKISSGKLMGIVGRALLESAPVPSLDGLREKLPNVPVPAGAAAPPGTEDGFGVEPSFAPTDQSDPFAEPADAPATEYGGSEPTPPEEDPFG